MLVLLWLWLRRWSVLSTTSFECRTQRTSWGPCLASSQVRSGIHGCVLWNRGFRTATSGALLDLSLPLFAVVCPSRGAVCVVGVADQSLFVFEDVDVNARGGAESDDDDSGSDGGGGTKAGKGKKKVGGGKAAPTASKPKAKKKKTAKTAGRYTQAACRVVRVVQCIELYTSSCVGGCRLRLNASMSGSWYFNLCVCSAGNQARARLSRRRNRRRPRRQRRLPQRKRRPLSNEPVQLPRYATVTPGQCSSRVEVLFGMPLLVCCGGLARLAGSRMVFWRHRRAFASAPLSHCVVAHSTAAPG